MAALELTCVERGCGTEFSLSDAEQNFFRDKGLSIPKRCRECRQKRKAQKNQAPVTEEWAEHAAATPAYDSRRPKRRNHLYDE